jgi:hypothetical protein
MNESPWCGPGIVASRDDGLKRNGHRFDDPRIDPGAPVAPGNAEPLIPVAAFWRNASGSCYVSA